MALSGYVGRKRNSAVDFFLASRTCGAFLLVMTIFGTTMTSFALVGSTGEAYRQGIGVYGQMASWSGLIHSACFFLIGTKLWYHGKRFGYSTQIQYFTDRFQSPAIGFILFPILVGWVVPYVVINVLGSGNIIQTVTAGAFPRLFPPYSGDQRRHSALAGLGHGLHHGSDLRLRRRHAEPVLRQWPCMPACSFCWAA